MANGNGDNVKVFGVPVSIWFQFVGFVGVPSIIVLVGVAMAYSQVPRLVDGHLELLKSTSATLQSMSVTQEKMAEAVDELKNGIREVVDVERSTKEFMARVSEEHQDHSAKLDEVLSEVKSQ